MVVESQSSAGPQTGDLRFAEQSPRLSAALDLISSKLDGIHPADAAVAAATRARAVHADAAYCIEYRLAREGRWRWSEERTLRLTGPDGDWLVLVTDVHDRRSATDTILRNEEQVHAAVTAIGVGLWTVELATGVWTWSSEFKTILGLRLGMSESGGAFMDRIHPDDRGRISPFHREPRAGGAVGLPTTMFRIWRADTGDLRWVVASSRVVLDETGFPARLIGTLQDVTERRQAELDREASELRLNAALNAGRMVIWDLEVASGTILRAPNAAGLFGSTPKTTADLVERVHPDDRPLVTWADRDAPRPPEGEVRARYLHPDGRQLWLKTSAIRISDEATPGHIVGITIDITDQKNAEDRLIYVANHDALTGLLNRKAWMQRLDEAVADVTARGVSLGLLLIDVDYFKAINDTLGHDAGDAVLTAIATRLQALSADRLLAARLGGDEFAALVCLDGLDEGLADWGDRLLRAIREPICHGDRVVTMGASIGMASCPDHATSVADLIKSADLALYAAKQAGRNRAHLFVPQLQSSFNARALLKSDVGLALAAGRIVPYYQPKLDLISGDLAGFEALARWRHPEHGLLAASVFAAAFEDGPLAAAIGKVIRQAVFRDLKAWLAQGLAVGRIAVNVAAAEFRGGQLAAALLQELADQGLPPAVVEIEIAEGATIERDSDQVARALDDLRRTGITVSLDDFGTGSASLLHLMQFPVDGLKIDRRFVADIGNEPNPALIRAILAMAKSLGLTVVAEGVETPAQAALLLGMGCPQGQGFHLAKPMSASRVPWYIRNRQGLRGPVARRA